MTGVGREDYEPDEFDHARSPEQGIAKPGEVAASNEDPEYGAFYPAGLIVAAGCPGCSSSPATPGRPELGTVT